MANKPTTYYDNLIKAAAESEVKKAFGTITATELKAVRVDSPLEMVAAHGRAVKKKEYGEFVDTRLKDFEDAYKKWADAKKPVDWLRHARGGIIGIQGAG